MELIKVEAFYYKKPVPKEDHYLNWIQHGDILADKYHASKRASIKSLNDLIRANKTNGKR
jgi:hypothetical protein